MTRYLEGVLNGKIEIQKTYYSTQAKAKAVEQLNVRITHEYDNGDVFSHFFELVWLVLIFNVDLIKQPCNRQSKLAKYAQMSISLSANIKMNLH